jgi:signal transduction histidine kinase
MLAVLWTTVAIVLVTGAIGAGVLQAVRHRSLLLSIVLAALVPVVGVSAAVAVNVNQMLISTHDTQVVSAALISASLLAVLLSYLLGRRVASGSRELTVALRGLTASRDGFGPETPAGARFSAPAELTALATELESTRSKLRASRDRELALERSRRELVAFMSHDLRTPLAGLRALAEGLEDDVIEDRAAALRQMQQTVGRMSALVDDLFELSRLNAGLSQEQPTRRPVSLVEVVHDVAGEANQTARRCGVVLRVDVEAAGDRLAVHGDSDELARALSNLVGNAVRHTPAGGTVVVAARRTEDGRAQVSVTDGCGGIDDRDLGRVFDIGWRGQPERGTDDAGAGLGLTIARGVVESHAGSLTVANVGGGCRFDVRLPAGPS